MRKHYKLLIVSGVSVFIGSIVAILWLLNGIYSCTLADSPVPAICNHLVGLQSIIKLLLLTTFTGLLIGLFGLIGLALKK